MSAWKRGADVIRALLKQGDLDQIVASDDLANRLLKEAEANLTSAVTVQGADPGGALQLAYDAAQGLRPTTAGGHVAVQRAVNAQFVGPFGPFGRMRRRRHQQ